MLDLHGCSYFDVRNAGCPNCVLVLAMPAGLCNTPNMTRPAISFAYNWTTQARQAGSLEIPRGISFDFLLNLSGLVGVLSRVVAAVETSTLSQVRAFAGTFGPVANGSAQVSIPIEPIIVDNATEVLVTIEIQTDTQIRRLTHTYFATTVNTETLAIEAYPANWQSVLSFEVTRDLAGASRVLTMFTPIDVVLGPPTEIDLVVTDLVTTPDADIVAQAFLSQSGEILGARSTLTQVTPGVFSGSILSAAQSAVDLDLPCYLVLLVGGLPACRPIPIRYHDLGIPTNATPVLTLTSPGYNSTVVPGALTIAFTCVDDDGILTAENFVALVDGVATLDAIDLSSGEGTGSVVGSASVTLTAVGAHSVGIRVTDQLGAIVSTIRTLTVTQPTLSITNPTDGSTIDDGSVLLSVATTPTAAASTVLRCYDNDILVGTGTVGAGVVTSALSVGAHSLRCEITTPVGVVTSGSISVTAESQTPQITIVAPTVGETLSVGLATVTAEITHTSGASAILPSTVRARFGTGAWTTLVRSGETDLYTASTVDTGTTEGSVTVTVEAGDRTPTSASATANVTITRNVAWNSTLDFGAASDVATVAPSGDLSINLDVSAPVNGRTYRVRLPATVASVSLDIVSGGTSVVSDVAAAATLPTGWRFVWDVVTATSWGQTADGAVPWTPGLDYLLLLRCDTVDQTIRMSGEIVSEIQLTGWQYRWRLAGDYTCENPVTGVAIPASDAVTAGVAPTFVTAPGDSTIADRTELVLRTTTAAGCARLPVNRGAGSWTLACWIYLAADITDLANGPIGIAGCWEPANGIWAALDASGDPALVLGPTTSVLARGAQCYGTSRGSWFHLAIQFNSANGEYITWANGRLISSQTLASNPQQQDSSLGWTVGGLIGVNTTPADGGNCYAREAAVSLSLLSGLQIRAHMRRTAPASIVDPLVSVECLGSSMSNANELSDPLDAALGENWVVRGGGVGGSGSDLAWGVGAAGSFVTQLPQAVQRLARGARTFVHHDPGLAVNAYTALNDWDAVEAAFWDEMRRMARIGLVPISHLMTGFASELPRGFGWRQRMCASWGAHALEFVECDWLSAIGLTTEAYYSEGIGVSGECGPHQSTTGRALVAAQIASRLQIGSGIA